MMAFHVGQHVVCVDDRERVFDVPGVNYNGSSLSPLTRGVVYTIRDCEYTSADGTRRVRLAEITRGSIRGVESGYNAARFRPLQKLNIQDFITERETA